MIESPESHELVQLCDQLSTLSDEQSWPEKALARCGELGFYRWFVPESYGGLGWSSADIAKGYLQLSAANLMVTFVLTQRVAAIRRIVTSSNESLKQEMLGALMTGKQTATVGISHLTTSRRHLGTAVVEAKACDAGFTVRGFCPWVTGGRGADWILLGGSVVDQIGDPNGEEILFLVKSDSPSLNIKPGLDMIALSASQTGAVEISDAIVGHQHLVAGPEEQVLTRHGGGAGSLQTSVLALGVAKAAIDFIESEMKSRANLTGAEALLRQQHTILFENLLEAASGGDAMTASEIRSQANSLVLRATQSAMVAAKGAGFVEGHPVGRWCREALFFLVWSCPQAVSQANLDEFAPCVSSP